MCKLRYELDYPHYCDGLHHRPAPNDIVSFVKQKGDLPGTGDSWGVAMVYQSDQISHESGQPQLYHSGWVCHHELSRFNARQRLEEALGRPFRGRIVSISEEDDPRPGGGRCSKGRLQFKLVREGD